MRKLYRKKEIRALIELIKVEFGVELFSKKSKVEIVDDIIYVEDEPMFFYLEKRLVPTLKLILKNNFLKKITVDMGAVKFVVGGADIMRPGIVGVDAGISKDDLVSIVDVNNSKPLAIGISMFSSEELEEMNSGNVIRNIHHVGDSVWNSNL